MMINESDLAHENRELKRRLQSCAEEVLLWERKLHALRRECRIRGDLLVGEGLWDEEDDDDARLDAVLREVQ
jgi:hypothetical protein